jgi:hypothetical protein
MLKRLIPAHRFKKFPKKMDFVLVLFSAKIGPARVWVPAGAKVEHIPCYFEGIKRYLINVLINGQLVGVHCGARTHEVIKFSRESDAVRLCAVRNAARRSS